MKYYIKERHNPQLGVYYVALGQLSKKEVGRKERASYGMNVVTGYTKAEYIAECRRLGIDPVGVS